MASNPSISMGELEVVASVFGLRLHVGGSNLNIVYTIYIDNLR